MTAQGGGASALGVSAHPHSRYSQRRVVCILLEYILVNVNDQCQISSSESRISPRWGRQSSGGGGGRQHTILPNISKMCMELKAFGCLRGRASKILLYRSVAD